MKRRCQHCGCEADLETLYRFCETKCPNCGLSMMSREAFSKILLEYRYPSRTDFFEKQMAKKYGEDYKKNFISKKSSIDDTAEKEKKDEGSTSNEDTSQGGEYITSFPVR